MEEYYLRGHRQDALEFAVKPLIEAIGSIEPDVYGTGHVIESFQNQISEEIGHETSIFFPSGTMAQQIALRLWCESKGNFKIAYHPLSHLEIHENDAIRVVHGITPVLLGDKERLFTLNDLMNAGEVACVLFELPQRDLGGQLPEWDDLISMVDYCRKNGIHTHLDGARIYETLPYYGKSINEVCALFDSVYISFYKTFGAITGAMLSGSKEFMKEAKVWKRRLGGDLYHLYPYILSAKSCFDRRKSLMGEYYRAAKVYAGRLNSIEGIRTVPDEPVSNMFHVHFDKNVGAMEDILVSIKKETGVSMFGPLVTMENGQTKADMWIGDAYLNTPESKCEDALRLLADLMR